ncbi:MAG: hypothetical protein ABSG59_24230, partial [Verrucomicrobiota bacterium]
MNTFELWIRFIFLWFPPGLCLSVRKASLTCSLTDVKDPAWIGLRLMRVNGDGLMPGGVWSQSR